PPPPPPAPLPPPPPPRSYFRGGAMDLDVLEPAEQNSGHSAKDGGNALCPLPDNQAALMARGVAAASLLFPAGPVLMECATMVGGRGEIKKDVDFPEAGED
ncbi:hypothetical protein, partial [Escherichia coli]|uniref:hypothetical protein n=1 Tax=Escherichia coli TaxID=562 RepID=UPI0035B4FC90